MNADEHYERLKGAVLYLLLRDLILINPDRLYLDIYYAMLAYVYFCQYV